jgi:hypothetical protein
MDTSAEGSLTDCQVDHPRPQRAAAMLGRFSAPFGLGSQTQERRAFTSPQAGSLTTPDCHDGPLNAGLPSCPGVADRLAGPRLGKQLYLVE